VKNGCFRISPSYNQLAPYDVLFFVRVRVRVIIFEPSAESLLIFENLESRFSVEASSHASRLLSRGQESLNIAFW
jgi:hypothetical protein